MFEYDLQSLSISVNESLEEWFVMGDGLQDVPISCHVSDRPLAQPSAAQPEDVAKKTNNQKVAVFNVHSMSDAV